MMDEASIVPENIWDPQPFPLEDVPMGFTTPAGACQDSASSPSPTAPTFIPVFPSTNEYNQVKRDAEVPTNSTPASPSSIVPDLYAVECIEVPLHRRYATFMARRLNARCPSVDLLPFKSAVAAAGDATVPSIPNSFAREPVQIELTKYLTLIHQLLGIEPACYLYAVSYLDHLFRLHPRLELGQHNVRRLALVALLVASKFVHDRPMNNKYWARKSGTFELKEINTMEAEFLQLINWQLQIPDEEFRQLEQLAQATRP